MRLRLRVTLAWVGLFGGLLATGTADAGLTYVSQTRFVEATAGDDIPIHPGNGETQTRSAAGLGPFDATAKVFYLQTGNGDSDEQDVRVNQRSRLDPASVRASGDFEVYSEDELVRYRSRVETVFDVTAETPYALSASLVLDETSSGSFNAFGPDDLYTVRLRRITPLGDVPLVEISGRSFLTVFQDPENLLPTNRQGVLAPGRYELLFNLDGFYNNGNQNGNYRLDFTAGTGDGNKLPAAVPLPPGGWAGLLTMAVAAGAARVRARCRKGHAS